VEIIFLWKWKKLFLHVVLKFFSFFFMIIFFFYVVFFFLFFIWGVWFFIIKLLVTTETLMVVTTLCCIGKHYAAQHCFLFSNSTTKIWKIRRKLICNSQMFAFSRLSSFVEMKTKSEIYKLETTKSSLRCEKSRILLFFWKKASMLYVKRDYKSTVSVRLVKQNLKKYYRKASRKKDYSHFQVTTFKRQI